MGRKKPSSHFPLFLISLLLAAVAAADDAAVMEALKKSINAPSSLGWTDSDPCKWRPSVTCSNDGRVTAIQIGHQNLVGSLPTELGGLTALQKLEVMGNELTGELPSLAGLGELQTLLLNDNHFTSIPPKFFSGMVSLQRVDLDYNNFTSWELPEDLKDCAGLVEFSANKANIAGEVPDFFADFASMTKLHLAINQLKGPIPEKFSKSLMQSLWLNGNLMNGTISVLQGMTQLSEIWLHSNSFTGPLPDFSKFINLQALSIRDNKITGPVPASLVGLASLRTVNLTNNMLQGPTPKFGPQVEADLVPGSNSFCLNDPGLDCDPQVNALLKVAEAVGYPQVFAQKWKGNDACASWSGISCNNGSVIVVNLPKMGLTGTISPSFSLLTSLQKLILSDNNLTGSIPSDLGQLSHLTLLDVTNNRLHGPIPKFTNNNNVKVNTDGNPDFWNGSPSPGSAPSGGGGGGGGDKKSNAGVVVGSVIGALCLVAAAAVAVFCLCKAKQKRRSGRVQSPNGVVVHPRFSGSDRDAVKITIANSGGGGGVASETTSNGSGGPSDIHGMESNRMVISIQILKDVTNNFNSDNIIGRGGFGTVYKGELDDGTKIAVKRMESGVMGDKGLDEFKSEIAVLTKVRHRHLVGLLGYCLEGNERILVFEYMPQGALSRHLFDWKEEGLKPLEWSKRLVIALDVARGVEYLHGLAHQSFIHRDLKPANILLGDDMRAKVADFGLVRLAPDGKVSVATKLAGTFGYLAPEYAVTGRVSTKIDVYSFGVILMELITGRKALHEGAPNEESVHLVTWFRRMHINKDAFRDVIDPTINLTDDTLASVGTVAELACHCTAREPSQRPDMGHAVNVLSTLTDLWKPSDHDQEDEFGGIDFDMSLPQAVQRWQALEGMTGVSSSFLVSGDNSHTSVAPRPHGFAETFRSEDAR